MKYKKLDAAQILKERGERVTKAKLALMDIVLSGAGPLSLSSINNSLSDRGLMFSRTTVYRELLSLEAKRLITCFALNNGEKFYEFLRKDSHHHHAVCLDCGKISDLPINGPCLLGKSGMRTRSFAPLYHTVNIYGYCRKCR